MKRLIFFVFILNSLLEPSNIRADSQGYLDQEVVLEFEPEQVSFLVELPGAEVKSLKGIYLPAGADNSEKQQVNLGRKKWLVGTALQVPDNVEMFKYNLLIVGKNIYGNLSQYAFLPELVWVRVDKFNTNIDALRTYLLTKKEQLKSWETQANVQQGLISRLKADAGVIAELGRIAEVQFELDRTNEQSKNLTRDLANLEQMIKLARASSSLNNTFSRLSQLTEQTKELAQAAKSAADLEFSRKSLSENELQRQLELIEATRADDYDLLQRDLLRIRKKRIELEKANRVSLSG